MQMDNQMDEILSKIFIVKTDLLDQDKDNCRQGGNLSRLLKEQDEDDII